MRKYHLIYFKTQAKFINRITVYLNVHRHCIKSAIHIHKYMLKYLYAFEPPLYFLMTLQLLFEDTIRARIQRMSLIDSD